MDGVACEGEIMCLAISEHVENAGVHSGDATLVTPPQDLNNETVAKIQSICHAVAKNLEVNGPFNIQLIAKVNSILVVTFSRPLLFKCFFGINYSHRTMNCM